MLTRGSVHGAEQYVLMPKAASNQLRYEVTLGEHVAGLRQVKGSQELEFLDETGTPRLRMTAPMALSEAKNGEDARRVALRLEVTDCAVDTSPKAPWGRAVTDPGARTCQVVVTWDPQKAVDRALLVDPAWTTTGSMTQERYDHTASVLSSGKCSSRGDCARPVPS